MLGLTNPGVGAAVQSLLSAGAIAPSPEVGRSLLDEGGLAPGVVSALQEMQMHGFAVRFDAGWVLAKDGAKSLHVVASVDRPVRFSINLGNVR